jgi:RNA polymerase sigma factor (sigma-70 family)
MQDQNLQLTSPELKRDELFTQRYAQLRAWAKRLTNNRDTADDLVHDAFVQFVQGRTSLEEISNIDGYLRRMLRYVYLSRLNRNSQKFFDHSVSISDYDSFHQTCRALQPPDRIHAQEELSAICTYACLRKETSRSASVLILRGFHDYLPTEIAAILRSTRHCIDQWQRLARKELKGYMSKRLRARIVNARAHPQIQRAVTKLSGIDCDFLTELRQMIFNSRQGTCFSRHELWKVYEHDNPDELTTTKLAHLVSCPECLDSVNQIVGLPALHARYSRE